MVPGPESYTGEDMAEFHVHGSKAVVDALHVSLSKIEGCRLAEPENSLKNCFSKWKNKFTKSRKYFRFNFVSGDRNSKKASYKYYVK